MADTTTQAQRINEVWAVRELGHLIRWCDEHDVSFFDCVDQAAHNHLAECDPQAFVPLAIETIERRKPR